MIPLSEVVSSSTCWGSCPDARESLARKQAWKSFPSSVGAAPCDEPFEPFGNEVVGSQKSGTTALDAACGSAGLRPA